MGSWADWAKADKDRWEDIETAFADYRHETPILLEKTLHLLAPLREPADLFVTDAAVYIGVPKTVVFKSMREAFGGRYAHSVTMTDKGPWRFAFDDMADVRIEEKRGALWLTVEMRDVPEMQWLKVRSLRARGVNAVMKEQGRKPFEEVWHRWRDRPETEASPEPR